MRSRGVVWVVAVMLAVTIGAGTASAQAPIVPATTVAAHSDDQPKVDPKDGEDKPKVDKPNVEVPDVEVPDVEVPKVEKSAVAAPKLEESGKATHDKANSEKPKPAPPKPKPQPETPKQAQPKPAKPKPQPETPKQAQPKPAKPKPTPQPKPAQPKSAQAGAPSAQPNELGPEPHVDAAKSVSPRPNAAPRVAASRIRHGTTRGRPAPNESGKAARRPAGAPGPERSAAELAGSGRDSADATAATGRPLAATPILAPRLASDGAAAASSSLDSQQPRVLILDARQSGYNTTLLLAIVLTAGVAFLFGRGVRRRPAAESRRLRRVPRSTRLDASQSRVWHRRD
jgi:hypothetical protein